MVEILLSRPKPQAADAAPRRTNFDPDLDAARHFGPVRDFLRRQPHVRAAWLTEIEADAAAEGASSAAAGVYDFMLLMDDPEDESLLDEAGTMFEALSPISVECRPALMNGDDESMRRLADQHPPFYRRADFLKED